MDRREAERILSLHEKGTFHDVFWTLSEIDQNYIMKVFSEKCEKQKRKSWLLTFLGDGFFFSCGALTMLVLDHLGWLS